MLPSDGTAVLRVALSACGVGDTCDGPDRPAYLGQVRLERGVTFDGMVVGGLSGAEHDP